MMNGINTNVRFVNYQNNVPSNNIPNIYAGAPNVVNTTSINGNM